MSLIHDALTNNLPPRARRKSSGSVAIWTFDCPLCGPKGHTVDRLKRGTVFLDPDGSAGYYCHQCHTRTRQQPDKALTQTMRELLEALGMDSTDVARLNHAMWSRMRNAQLGRKPAPLPQPLPTGARPIGDWIADNIADPNFNDLLEELADMNPERRDGYFWTPEGGTTGDMNRRYIWVIGDPALPDAWIARSIDDSNPEPIVGDPDAWMEATPDDDGGEEAK